MTELITSPDGAEKKIVEQVGCSCDPEYALCITVHVVGDTTVCNFWEFDTPNWNRVLPERCVSGPQVVTDLMLSTLSRFWATTDEEELECPAFQSAYKNMLAAIQEIS